MNWYYWQCETHFNGPYPSREDAIEAGKKDCEDYSFNVQQADTQDYCLSMAGCDVIEELYGQNEDLIGEGDFIEPTPEQERDLGKMVTAAIYAWVEKHNIDTKAWALDVQGKPELVEGEHQ